MLRILLVLVSAELVWDWDWLLVGSCSCSSSLMELIIVLLEVHLLLAQLIVILLGGVHGDIVGGVEKAGRRGYHGGLIYHFVVGAIYRYVLEVYLLLMIDD